MFQQPRRICTALIPTILAVIGLTQPEPAHAAYKMGDDESYLKIGGLLQVHALMAEKDAPDGTSASKELFIRRMRLMAYGQINRWVNFFVETDNPNFGKKGDFSGNTFIQDAYLELNLHPMIQVDFGMMLVPFSHHGMQGATSLLALDYHGALIRYPQGSHKVWRDFGVMFRGMFSKWVEYRLALLNGVHGGSAVTIPGEGAIPDRELTDPRNQTDAPRFTARLTFNLFEPEGGAGVGGMFYDGLYIKKTDVGVVSTKRVLSVGGSMDFQPNVNAVLTAADAVDSRSAYFAAAGDVFWDIPIGPENIMSLNGQANFYYFDHGDSSSALNYLNVAGVIGNQLTGFGMSSEVGYRYDAWQPVLLFDYFNATDFSDSTGDFMGIYGGINYWLFAHATSLKVQLGASRVADKAFTMSAVFQAQLLF